MEQTNDALGRLSATPRRAGLLEVKAAALSWQLSQIKNVRDAAVTESCSMYREVKTLEARVRILCDTLHSLKRRESTNCNLKVITCKVVDA